MPICPSCKTPLGDDVRFCPLDGTALPAPEAAEVPEARTRAAAGVIDPRASPTRPLKSAPEGGDETVDKLIDNRYRILERIGEGGVGVVYRAEHVQIRRPVAVKVLHPLFAAHTEFRLRFEREAMAASKATHPACVAVLDFGTFEGRPYLVMELVEGRLLAERLKERPLSPAEAVLLARQVLGALRHAHALGIIHRDVKPGNIMLCEPTHTGAQVKLLDFGLAKSLDPGGPGASTLTQAGTVFGTPSYLSPEQALGAPADARSDLYSLGVVLYEMACGRKPFVDDDPVEVIRAHINRPPPPARQLRPEISLEFEAVIARALAKDRAARFQTADEMIAALAAVPEVGGAPARPSPGARRPAGARAVRPGRLVAAGAILVVAAVGVTLAVGLTGRKPRAAGPAAPVPPAARVERAAPQPAAGAPPVKPAASEKREAATATARTPSAELRRAEAELRAGRSDRAINLARRAVTRDRSDARPHLVLGHAYYAKLWHSDALEEYERAVALDPAVRSDAAVLQHAIACLGRAKTASRARTFLVKTIGEPAIPALRAAAADDPDPVVRRRASAALQRLAAR